MLSTDQYLEIFQPDAKSKMASLVERGNSLVHYTSATNALRILRTKRVTLRNASLMNDFSEIDFGEQCVSAAWQSDHGKGSGTTADGRLYKLLGGISKTIFSSVELAYNENTFNRRSNTFIISLAEHNEATESTLGRLSMWRAYGGRTNVAIVVNPDFVNDDAISGAFIAPVNYFPVSGFPDYCFSGVVNALERQKDVVAKLDRDFIVECLLQSLNTYAMSTKHPGFSEEREWRVIYAPWMTPDDSIISEVIDVAGIPQKVYCIPLEANVEKKRDFSVSRLIKKIIIGPTENPWVLFEAFAIELDKLGVADPSKKIVVSDIPIRR